MQKTIFGKRAFADKPRFEILDGLRGVAAFMVVAFHLLESYCGGDHTRQIINHAEPYFAPANAPWVNGLYEALVILLSHSTFLVPLWRSSSPTQPIKSTTFRFALGSPGAVNGP